MPVTLSNLSKSKAQTLFNQVAQHLLDQGEKSSLGTQCYYHDGNGKMCAAGCLISKKEYDFKFEDNNWEQLIKRKYVPERHGDLISDLQKIHDGRNTKFWRNDLIELSEKHGLKVNF